MSLNRVSVIGNLGKDPEVSYTQAGTARARFSVATSERYRDRTSGEDREETEWHNVVVWGKQAEVCGKHLTKGRQVYVEGKLRTRSWDDEKTGQKRYMTEVIANHVIFLGGLRGERGSTTDGNAEGEPNGNVGGTPQAGDSDIPF